MVYEVSKHWQVEVYTLLLTNAGVNEAGIVTKHVTDIWWGQFPLEFGQQKLKKSAWTNTIYRKGYFLR